MQSYPIKSVRQSSHVVFGGLLVDLQKGRMECFRTQMHSLRIMVDAVKEFLTSNISE